jgi:aryl-alcohol dehydrogenase-like predicted oxidoreductase
MLYAFDSGINHFDTAQSYHNGQGECVFSECIEHWQREQIILASKMELKKSKDETLEGVKASLKNLNTDYLDIFYIHWPLGDTDPRPMMEGLEECRTKGMIKGIGVSNFSVEQLELLAEVGTVDIVQFCYNLLWRKHEEDLIPYCLQHDIGMIAYSALAQGILTGKYPEDYVPGNDDARARSVFFRDDAWPAVYESVLKMKYLGDEAGKSLVELAITWILRQDAVLSVLIGARSTGQVARNVSAVSGSVNDIIVDDIILDKLTHISHELEKKIPDTGNIFQYYPK